MRNRQHREEKRRIRWKVRRVLWGIYYDPVTYMLLATEERPKPAGAIEIWVDGAHEKGNLLHRIKHAVRCLQLYIHTVTRPAAKIREKEEEGRHRIKEARQRLFKRAYSIYKNELQRRMLEERAEQRRGLVCASIQLQDKRPR